jgi:hypothetical protein
MGLANNIKSMQGQDYKIAVRYGLAADLATQQTVNLFTIDRGPIVVQGFFGVVSTALAATATTIAVQLTTSTAYGATSVPVAVATATLSGYVVGSILTLAGGVGAALTLQTGAARGVGVYSITNQQAWVNGILQIVVGGAANATGIIDWYLQYRPAVLGARAY